MKPPKFHAGQAVQVIDGKFPSYCNEVFPKQGRIYTIRFMLHLGGVWWIMLDEIINYPRQYSDAYRECSFNEARFAPVELASDEDIAELIKESLTPVTA